MPNDWIIYTVLATVGAISFGWLLVAANRASKEEREWHRKLREAARRHQEAAGARSRVIDRVAWIKWFYSHCDCHVDHNEVLKRLDEIEKDAADRESATPGNQ